MDLKEQNVVSNLYETSKSGNGKSMLPIESKDCEVYDLDKLKDKFCDSYRNKEKIKSCDAYYYDQYNYIVMEFKNTHHKMLKEYFGEIEIKILDTHMLLAETFWRKRKSEDIANKVKLLVIYNDSLNVGEGVNKILSSLNGIEPITGDKTRKSVKPLIFDDAEYDIAVSRTKDMYETEFYYDIQFIDKNDFEKDYVEGDYFNKLESRT